MSSSLPSSSDSSPAQGPEHHESGAGAGWGLIIGSVSGLLPALILGGRWWSLFIFTATVGWLIGAFIDRARS